MGLITRYKPFSHSVAVGKLVSMCSPYPAILISENAKVLGEHNSWWIRLFNRLLIFRRKSYLYPGWHSTFFLLVISDRFHPPKIQAYSKQKDPIVVTARYSGLKGFSPAGLSNTGYWVPGQSELVWVWPRKAGNLHFLMSDAEARKETEISEESWLLRTRDESVRQHEAITHVENSSVYPSGLLFDEKSIIDSDPAQVSETYRRGCFPIGEHLMAIRKIDAPGRVISEGVFLGSNLDFLFFESLVYGLPKILDFLSEKEPTTSRVLMNDYTNRSTLKLFNRILVDRGYKPALQPSFKSPIFIERLKVFHGSSDWVSNLVNRLPEIQDLGREFSLDKNQSWPVRRVVLLRESSARVFDNRLPINMKDLVEVCREFGFIPIDPGSLSIAKQISLFRNVDFIISPHGGALANLVWAERKPKVLEIFSGWNDSCFSQLSKGLDLEYRSFNCGDVVVKDSFTLKTPVKLALGRNTSSLLAFAELDSFQSVLKEFCST